MDSLEARRPSRRSSSLRGGPASWGRGRRGPTRCPRTSSEAHLSADLLVRLELPRPDLPAGLLELPFRLLAEFAQVFEDPLDDLLVRLPGMELHPFELRLGGSVQLDGARGHGGDRSRSPIIDYCSALQ